LGHVHLLLQLPQLAMSFLRLTQAPPQHPNPGMPHAPQAPPELLLEEPVDELPDPVDDDPVDELDPLVPRFYGSEG
jgi:hypothetical protein